jgi:dipeptidyl-peptidase-4
MQTLFRMCLPIALSAFALSVRSPAIGQQPSPTVPAPKAVMPAPVAPVPAPRPPAIPELLTIAESSDFQASSMSEQVVTLLDEIASRSPYAFRTSMGTTFEGRDMPMIVLSNPRVSSPQEAQKLADEQGRAVVFIFGNIHAGENDAKEAYLMLARELALVGTEHDAPQRKEMVPDAEALLKQLVIIIAPNYNADGNDIIKPIEVARPGQAGPAQGAGQRHNAMDRDLNRDFGKLETPEGRNLVRAVHEWNPHVIIDGHTTNGSWHHYLMTYAGPKVPAGDERLITWTRDVFFKRIDEAMLRTHQQHTFFYGDFEGEYDATDPNVPDGTFRVHTKWTTFPAVPRYSTGYFGLRNRIGILSESYSYSSYHDRIVGSRALALEVLREVAKDRANVRAMVQAADEDGAGKGATGKREIAIRGAAAKAPERAQVLGYVEERRAGKWTNTGEHRSYDVEVWNRYEPTQTVSRPLAYAFTSDVPAAIANLRMHGIKLDVLQEPKQVQIEQYTIESASPASRAFQGHVLLTAEAALAKQSLTLPAGTTIVHTNQPLGTLAVYLLEPESEDGLLTWNFFDEWAKPGAVFPVVRVVGW